MRPEELSIQSSRIREEEATEVRLARTPRADPEPVPTPEVLKVGEIIQFEEFHGAEEQPEEKPKEILIIQEMKAAANRAPRLQPAHITNNYNFNLRGGGLSSA